MLARVSFERSPVADARFGGGVDALVDEFGRMFSRATIVRYLVEAIETVPGASFGDDVPNHVHRFVRERLTARMQVEGKIARDVPEVLFACVRNSGGSQMGAALLRRRVGGLVHVRSAGTDPAEEIEPNVLHAMGELGIDLSRAYPKPLTDDFVRAADAVITMGCGDACPFYPGTYREDWKLDDPAGRTIEAVRRTRDEIDRRVAVLLRTCRLDVLGPAASAQDADVQYLRLKI